MSKLSFILGLVTTAGMGGAPTKHVVKLIPGQHTYHHASLVKQRLQQQAKQVAHSRQQQPVQTGLSQSSTESNSTSASSVTV